MFSSVYDNFTTAGMLKKDGKALLDPRVTQIGLSVKDNCAILLLDREFETDEEYLQCEDHPPTELIKFNNFGEEDTDPIKFNTEPDSEDQEWEELAEPEVDLDN